ncbi:GntR family transcriptional regulator [Microvirga aerophila]|uniref:GntR family transcriptional regulator n=1 Tax=Microvirga aerophila TaxID=670291 RepID=A0A512BXP5_9HYPH|nr:GntR family transcriptional regulator [Microvirga aerophila]GEO16713.1 GntR family transcriptional regulator [Microvirga aerophila]
MMHINTRANRVLSGGQLLPDVLGLELSAILERRIVYLELRPGTHLTEQQVCEEFNISRSPVREAFRQLEAIGLVVRHARRGVRVTPMTIEHLEEIYFCRTPLEALAASCAARNADQDDLDFMRDCLEHMKDAMGRGDSKGFFDHNVAFINRLNAATGNKMLMNILSIIEKQALRYRYFAHTSSDVMLETSFAGLNTIYEGLLSRKPGKVKSATSALMKNAQRIISAALREHGDLSRWDAQAEA